MTSKRRSLSAAVRVFVDDCDWPRVAELSALVAWANVAQANPETFKLPGTCWSGDRTWIKEVKDAGDLVRPLLDRDIVLGHCVRIAMAMNPMAIAAQANVRPGDLARQLAAHLTMEALGGGAPS